MLDHANLPAVRSAKLPVAYEAAREALAACDRVDECKSWADKAAALASYAKQSKDETMERTAVRIRGRAIRRCGELIKEIEPAKNQHDVVRRAQAGDGPSTRSGAGRVAGLSPRQTKEALRVANVPREEFEEAIEAEKPATVTDLAERGKVSKPKPLFDLQGRDPADFRASTEAQGEVERMAAVAARITPTLTIRGALDHERDGLLKDAIAVLDWMTRLVAELKKGTR